MKSLPLTLCAMLGAALAFGQESPPMEKPGKHHEYLKLMAGTWDVESKIA